jgi:hypothetical protein
VLTEIKVSGKEVPRYLRGDYAGRTFRVAVANEVTIPADSNLWSGGSRDSYRAVLLATGDAIQLGSRSAPWDPTREDKVIKMSPDIAIVRHSMFLGKDMGLTFFIHPANAPKFIK